MSFALSAIAVAFAVGFAMKRAGLCTYAAAEDIVQHGDPGRLLVFVGATAWAATYTVPAASASQYLRVRGSNLPPSVPFETDASGNPLSDLFTNASDTSKLKIPCTTVGTNVPPLGTRTPSIRSIDGCPTHLPVVGGVKYVAYDVAAWSDLWFYGNPIYIQVTGSTLVAGVKNAVEPSRTRAAKWSFQAW